MTDNYASWNSLIVKHPSHIRVSKDWLLLWLEKPYCKSLEPYGSKQRLIILLVLEAILENTRIIWE